MFIVVVLSYCNLSLSTLNVTRNANCGLSLFQCCLQKWNAHFFCIEIDRDAPNFRPLKIIRRKWHFWLWPKEKTTENIWWGRTARQCSARRFHSQKKNTVRLIWFFCIELNKNNTSILILIYFLTNFVLLLIKVWLFYWLVLFCIFVIQWH